MKQCIKGLILVLVLVILGFGVYSILGVSEVERVAESTGSSLKILEDKSLKRLEGTAYGVYDGDTCWISLKNGDKEKLRFVHIDAPEKNQPMGLESQKFLANLID